MNNQVMNKYQDDSPSDITRKVESMSLDESRREVNPFREIFLEDFEFEPDQSRPSEKIVFIVDLTDQRLLDDIKNAINIFVTTKNAMSSEHEFALLAMRHNSSSRAQEFTNAPKQMIKTVNRLQASPPAQNELCVFDEVFDTLQELKNKPSYKHYIFRVIFFYARCMCEPALMRQNRFTDLVREENVILDGILLSQRPMNEDQLTRMTNAYRSFAKMIVKGRDYVVHNPTELTVATMKLLAHPNQRVNLPEYNYSVNPILLGKKKEKEQEPEQTYM